MRMATIMAEGLILRPLEMSDATIICNKIYTKENTKYMLFRNEQNIDETLNFLEDVIKQYNKSNPKFLEFGVTYSNVLIGIVSLSKAKMKCKTYEIGWIIDPLYADRDIMTHSASAVLDYCKKNGVKKIIAHCDVKNEPSIGLMEKLGMKRVNTISPRVYSNGETSYELMYELVL